MGGDKNLRVVISLGGSLQSFHLEILEGRMQTWMGIPKDFGGRMRGCVVLRWREEGLAEACPYSQGLWLESWHRLEVARSHLNATPKSSMPPQNT